MYGRLIDEAHVCLHSVSGQSVYRVMSSRVDLCNTWTEHQICSFDKPFIDDVKSLFYVRAGVT